MEDKFKRRLVGSLIEGMELKTQENQVYLESAEQWSGELLRKKTLDNFRGSASTLQLRTNQCMLLRKLYTNKLSKRKPEGPC